MYNTHTHTYVQTRRHRQQYSVSQRETGGVQVEVGKDEGQMGTERTFTLGDWYYSMHVQIMFCGVESSVVLLTNVIPIISTKYKKIKI